MDILYSSVFTGNGLCKRSPENIIKVPSIDGNIYFLAKIDLDFLIKSPPDFEFLTFGDFK